MSKFIEYILQKSFIYFLQNINIIDNILLLCLYVVVNVDIILVSIFYNAIVLVSLRECHRKCFHTVTVFVTLR